jgi:tetratricopeptide (TPR) repeat protein
MNIAQAWASCEAVVRFAKKYTRGLLIAFVLAIVAAVLYKPCKDYVTKRASKKTLENNAKAIATLTVYDAKGDVIARASGIFTSPDGRLVTNYHVLATKKFDHIVAQLPTKAFYVLKNPIAVSKKYDLAILQFDANEVPFVRINTAITAQAREHILAIGSPMGLEQSVSEGVISYPQRQIAGVDFIQFTAPISPGSSGGGLFNMSGRILGITTMSWSDQSWAENLNFAVPVKYIDKVSEGGPEFTKDSPDYFYAEGVINTNKKNFAKAEENFKNAIRIDKNYVNAYTNLGDLYYETGRYNDGVEILESARTILPNDPDINYALGLAYETISRYDEAIAAYKTVLGSRPEDKDALYYVCLLDLITGRSEEVSNYVPRLKRLNIGIGKEIEMLMSRGNTAEVEMSPTPEPTPEIGKARRVHP